ncbi:hypothetical protein LU290_03285 [Moraxella nasibovis]|uniref:hypothetical protein n=1 Tax=Moraxella nasibovis TaxID=2904120 RepID=UPI00240EA562|nr:hypothetical protein [Moraxella nasibovis]WFF39259.1 hypothetical protein LU290_03285 [Moraxella nasibovis]
MILDEVVIKGQQGSFIVYADEDDERYCEFGFEFEVDYQPEEYEYHGGFKAVYARESYELSSLHSIIITDSDWRPTPMQMRQIENELREFVAEYVVTEFKKEKTSCVM